MASPSEFTCGKRAAKFHEENSTFCKIIHAKVVLHRIEGFREYLGPDGKESVGLKKELELPQIKEEGPEFPQQQMRDERLPIKKEDDVTWSFGEFLKREVELGVTSRGAEPAHTLTLPQIKEEEPEFPQQQIKKEEDVTVSTGEPFKSEVYLGVTSRGAEPAHTLTLPQIKEEEPEFPQQQIKKEEEDVTVSTGEPFKSEDYLGVAGRGAQTPNGSSAEGVVWLAAGSVIAEKFVNLTMVQTTGSDEVYSAIDHSRDGINFQGLATQGLLEQSAVKYPEAISI
ncbi:uncharacterized protein LOC144066118 [Stigmatopora argus]